MTKSKSKKKQAQAQTPSKAQMKAKTEVLELALKLSKTGPDQPVIEGLVLAHILEEQRLLREELAAFRRNERRSTIQSLDDRIKAVHRRIDEVEKEVTQQRETRTPPRRQSNADDDDWSDGDNNVDGLYRTVGRLKRKFLTLKLDVVRLGRAVATATTDHAPQACPEAPLAEIAGQQPADTAPEAVDVAPPATLFSHDNQVSAITSAANAVALETEILSTPGTVPPIPRAAAKSTCPAEIEHWLKHALNTIRADFASRADKLDEMMLDFAARVRATARDKDDSIPEIWQSQDDASSDDDTIDLHMAREAEGAHDPSWSPPLWEGGGPEGLGRSPSPESLDSWDTPFTNYRSYHTEV